MSPAIRAQIQARIVVLVVGPEDGPSRFAGPPWARPTSHRADPPSGSGQHPTSGQYEQFRRDLGRAIRRAAGHPDTTGPEGEG